MAGTDKITRAALRTPRAAAIAGIAFALILGTALVLVRLAVPADPDANAWTEEGWRTTAVSVALYLVPFAGLAFLWFIGVVRDRMGAAEDRLFATVFFGTGLLFVAMLFVAAAAGGALIEVSKAQGTATSDDVWSFGRHSTYLILLVYGMRMAGAFTIVTTSIASKLGMVPRWLVLLGWVSAFVLLVTVESFPWGVMLFPIWVLALSVHFLTHPPAADRHDAPAVSADPA